MVGKVRVHEQGFGDCEVGDWQKATSQTPTGSCERSQMRARLMTEDVSPRLDQPGWLVWQNKQGSSNW